MDRWNVKHFLDESQAAESNSAAKVRSQEPTLRLKLQIFSQPPILASLCRRSNSTLAFALTIVL
jgi:hypothetical protein